jgi:hypothetical protein
MHELDAWTKRAGRAAHHSNRLAQQPLTRLPDALSSCSGISRLPYASWWMQRSSLAALGSAGPGSIPTPTNSVLYGLVPARALGFASTPGLRSSA